MNVSPAIRAKAVGLAATLRSYSDARARALNVGNDNPMVKTVDGHANAIAELAEIVAEICRPDEPDHVYVQKKDGGLLERVGGVVALHMSNGSDWWSEERVKHIRRRWLEGASGGVIAEEIGNTRNAVLGKLWRLGAERPYQVNRTNMSGKGKRRGHAKETQGSSGGNDGGRLAPSAGLRGFSERLSVRAGRPNSVDAGESAAFAGCEDRGTLSASGGSGIREHFLPIPGDSGLGGDLHLRGSGSWRGDVRRHGGSESGGRREVAAKTRATKSNPLATSVEPVPEGGVSLMQLGHSSCRWSIGTDGMGEHLFCGRPADRPYGYCEDLHARMAYAPRRVG